MAAQATFKSIKSVIPLFDRVLVQRFKAETKTASGIFLPSTSTNTPLPEATVIAVGPGAPNKDGNVLPEYFLFRDSEILAKIQE
uniref:Kinesin motor protein n=1 Tax=Ganoderma boninense TaxID=34458 RepID=A0A5K1K3L5_9APHY|nr:Kinesin motor protein [Ganoderma boninense]